MQITRKIELWVDSPEKDIRNAQWRFIHQLNNDVFKAANLIVNHQFYNETHKDRTILNDIRNNENKVKELKIQLKQEKNSILKEQIKAEIQKTLDFNKELRKSTKDFIKKEFGISQQHTTYEIIKQYFPEMPSYIRGALNNTVVSNFYNEIFDVKTGKRSLRTYRNNLPIPFMKSVMNFYTEGEEVFFKWVNNIKFKLNFGRDKSNNRSIIKNILEGIYRYGDSSIQLKDNKIFLLLVVDVPNQIKTLNPNIAVGVDLGINIPAYAALSEGNGQLPLGSRNDFLRVRLQMQERRRVLQKSLKMTNGGKGRTKKLKALEDLKEKEKNFAKTYNHNLSHQVVKFAVDNNAATIKLEFLKGFGEEEKNKFLLRNWSYFQLQTMIEYKAQKEGIEVHYIDPYHTSQTCHVCGHYEKGQRESQEKFICKNEKCINFAKSVNADYNGAVNIAKSVQYVEFEEDCQYFKNKKEDIRR